MTFLVASFLVAVMALGADAVVSEKAFLPADKKLAALPALTRAATAEDPWAAVTERLETWPFMEDFAVTAGDAKSGRQYAFERGAFNLTRRVEVASSSKFPAAVAIAGAVADAFLSFDTKANEVFDWWTTTDVRANVTLRHLLSFRSGFFANDASGDADCFDLGNNDTAEECAREIYEEAPFLFAPGTTFDYNSYHLQIAGAMAAKSANLTVTELLRTYVLNEDTMPRSFYQGAENPMLAGALVTCADDYDTLLQRYLAHALVPEDVADQMEIDYLASSDVSNSSEFLVESLGHYSMCTWFECLFNYRTGFRQQCAQRELHVDAGLFGWYPVLNRANDTYFLIAQQDIPVPGEEYIGKPTLNAILLRLAIKPLIDDALAIAASTQRERAAAAVVS